MRPGVADELDPPRSLRKAGPETKKLPHWRSPQPQRQFVKPDGPDDTEGDSAAEAGGDDIPFSSSARELHLHTIDEWNHYTNGKKGTPTAIRQVIGKTASQPVKPLQSPNDDIEAGIYRGHRLRWLPPVMDPHCASAHTWSFIITITDLTYSAFLVPLGAAFHFNPQFFSWYNAVDIVAGALFWIDIYMGFSIGIFAVYSLKRCVVMDRRRIAEFYVKRDTFWADLLSALPVIVEIIVLCIPNTSGGLAVHIIFLLRLARLYRVTRLLEHSVFVSMTGRYSSALMRRFSIGHLFLVCILYVAAVALNLLACIWYYVATLEGLGNSWLTSVGSAKDDLSGASAPRQWVAALYFVTMTLTTVGYGDVSARTAIEQLVAVVFMLLGVLIFGIVIATSRDLMMYLSRNTRRVGLLRNKLQHVETWTTRRRLSPRLRQRVRAYYAKVHEAHIFGELPGALRTEVAFELAQPLLLGSAVFAELEPDARRAVTTRLTPLDLPAGHDLYRQGDDAKSLYFLQEGELLSIFRREEVEVIRGPAIVGETALVARQIPACRTYAVTMRAASTCVLWELTVRDLRHLFRVAPGLQDSLMRSFLEHLERQEAGRGVHLGPEQRLGDVKQRVQELMRSTQGRALGEGEPEQPSSSAAASAASNSPPRRRGRARRDPSPLPQDHPIMGPYGRPLPGKGAALGTSDSENSGSQRKEERGQQPGGSPSKQALNDGGQHPQRRVQPCARVRRKKVQRAKSEV